MWSVPLTQCLSKVSCGTGHRLGAGWKFGSSDPSQNSRVRICLLIISPGAPQSVRCTTIPHPVFPPQDLCTCCPLHLDNPLFSWPGLAPLILDSYATSSEKPPSIFPSLKSFSLNRPILFIQALFAVCNYRQSHCMPVSVKAEAMSHCLRRNAVGSAQTRVE